MRTNTRVEFGLYDVTARGDSSPGSTDAQPWNNVSEDLRRAARPVTPKYGTLEQRQFLMDGSFELFPDDPRGSFFGLWSRQQSGPDGTFADPPILEISFSQPHSSASITLHFYAPTEDWANKALLQWYDASGYLLHSAQIEPDAVDWYSDHKVQNYSKLRITFLSTNNPGRYLKLAGIDYGMAMTFAGPDVVEAHVLEEVDPLSDTISVNTLNLTLYNREGRFSVLNSKGVIEYLQYKQKFTVFEDVHSTSSADIISYNMGTFYLSEWSNTSDTVADFKAIDAVGLLEDAPYDGGVYDTTAGALVAEILTGYDYQISPDLAQSKVQGWLPIGTRRSALQQLAFAIGAVVDCSRSDKIKIYPAPQRPSAMITGKRKLQGSKVSLRPLVTGVSVTAHRYQLGTAVEELFKDTLPEGIHQITFQEPVAEIKVTGGKLIDSGSNSATVSVASAQEVTLSGQKYKDHQTVHHYRADGLPPNVLDNEVQVEQATLVSPDRAPGLARRILDYYDRRYEQSFRLVAGSERLADMLIVESFGGELLRGSLEKMEFDLTGGYLADVCVVGRRLDATAAAYAGEIYAPERSLI